MTDHVLEFTPWQSVGIFKFDDDITNYQNELTSWIFEPLDKYGDEHYKTPNDTRIISVHNNKIGSIFCYETLIYQGVNLIGLTIDEFKNITQSDYVGTTALSGMSVMTTALAPIITLSPMVIPPNTQAPHPI